MTGWRILKKKNIAKNHGQPLREIFHLVPKQIFLLKKKILDEAVFYCIRDFLAPQRTTFYSMAFLSDVGSHLDLWINLERLSALWND